MTPQSLANQIEGLVISANERYARQIIGVQSKLYNDLVTILKFIETDADGNILQNAGNRAILRAGQNQFDKTILNSAYQSAVEDHLRVIPKIDELNAAYFESVSSAFLPNRVFIKQLQASAIETVNSFVLQDGLAAQVKLPLNEILNQNINSGGSFSGMLKQVETFVKGNDQVEGRLLRYTRTYISDAIFNYSRAYQQAVTADLKLEFYLYSGGLMDKSRPFCIERAGKFFHHNEIEGWASESWAGKNPLTTESSIFVLAGGFSCRHSIIPVHENIVDSDVIERAKAEGYIN
jgi:hypothetical protein